MIQRMCVAMAGFFWFTTAVAAQPTSALSNGMPARSFEELRFRVSVGDTVRIVDGSGRGTTGRAATVSDVAIALTVGGASREFAATEVLRVDRRRRDPVRNGLLIGAGGGMLLGYAVGRSADSPACPRSKTECGQGALIGAAGGAFWGALGGWIADALIRKWEVVYVATGAE